jgi:hypothetical protein
LHLQVVDKLGSSSEKGRECTLRVGRRKSENWKCENRNRKLGKRPRGIVIEAESKSPPLHNPQARATQFILELFRSLAESSPTSAKRSRREIVGPFWRNQRFERRAAKTRQQGAGCPRSAHSQGFERARVKMNLPPLLSDLHLLVIQLGTLIFNVDRKRLLKDLVDPANGLAEGFFSARTRPVKLKQGMHAFSWI